jgi:long-chain acyl-CoA synthetase
MGPTTPLNALYDRADTHPEGIACVAGRNIWTYRRLAIAVEQVAQGLYARGVRPGDRVALHMFNISELVIAYFACFRIGAVAAPLNTRFKTAELREVLKRLRPRVYVGQAQLYAQVAAIETDILAADSRYVVGETVVGGRVQPWTNLLQDSASVALPELPDADSPAVLLCTSGTTGLPKFVTHTAATLTAAVEACGRLELDRPQIAINSLPLVHAAGFFVTLACLRFGSIVVLVERFDADAVLNAIESFHGTWLLGLPVMFVELLRRQCSKPRMVDSLEFCAVAGDVCPAKVQESFPAIFGVPLHSLWGSTEVPGSLIHGLQPGPVSRIASGAEVRLVDDNGMQVSRGEVGEMLIRGPNVTIGYWVGPDRIDPATVEGWYASGDLMRQGEQDDLWFISRKKDLIIRGGSNIWPAEIERVLLDHPAVTDAAVVGVPDADLGERVVGFVCLAAGWSQYLIDDVLASARAQLADYKVPEALQVIAEIPRNTLGKVDRASLRSLPPAGVPERGIRRVAPMWIALALTLGVLAPNAWASELSDPPSITVRYDDLNLSTKRGVEILHRRINAAAQQVCGDGYEPGDLSRALAYHRCVNSAAEKALEKVQIALSQVQWVVK